MSGNFAGMVNYNYLHFHKSVIIKVCASINHQYVVPTAPLKYLKRFPHALMWHPQYIFCHRYFSKCSLLYRVTMFFFEQTDLRLVAFNIRKAGPMLFSYYYTYYIFIIERYLLLYQLKLLLSFL